MPFIAGKKGTTEHEGGKTRVIGFEAFLCQTPIFQLLSIKLKFYWFAQSRQCHALI